MFVRTHYRFAVKRVRKQAKADSATSPAYRTAIVPVTLSAADYRRAHDAAHKAGLAWNQLVDFQRTHWATHHVDPTLKELRHFVCSLGLPLHAHTKQALCDDLQDAVATSRANRKAGLKMRPPWREKRYRPLTFTRGYGWRRTPKGRLGLSLGRGRPGLLLPSPSVSEPAGNAAVPMEQWGQMQLCWDRDARQWALHIAVPTAAPPGLDPTKVLAIDEGIINPMTVAVATPKGFEVTVINGRAARAVKHRRNAAVSALRSRMDKATKGSRQWRHYDRARKRAQAHAARCLRDSDHKVSRAVATVAQTHQTGRIVVGDVRGIEQKTRQREKRRFGCDQRRRLSQWSRGRQEQYLEYKTGVDLDPVSEAHSSQTCPACLTRNRPQGRLYRCSCGFSLHRDAVGAINILMRATQGDYRPIDPDAQIRVLYRRATPLHQAGPTRRKARNRATAGDSDGHVADRKRANDAIPAFTGPTDRKIATSCVLVP